LLKIKNILLVIFATTLFCTELKSQDLPVHEQYMFDFMLVNPSFTGLTQSSIFKAIHRQQWIGFENAPKTSLFLFKHRLKGREGGIGGYVFSDLNGPNQRFGAQFNFSYQVFLYNKRNHKFIMSFGMAFRGWAHVLDQTKFTRNMYDPIVTYSKETTVNPNASAGVLFSYNHTFLGVAFDNLLPWTDRMYNRSLEPINHVLTNLHAGSILQIHKKVQLRPSCLFKSNFHGLNQLDVNLKVHYGGTSSRKSKFVRKDNDMWFGLSYRNTLDKGNSSPLSIAPSFGMSIDQFSIFYQYEIGLTSLQLYHNGTHQIGLGLKIFHDKYIKWGKFHNAIFYDEF